MATILEVLRKKLNLSGGTIADALGDEDTIAKSLSEYEGGGDGSASTGVSVITYDLNGAEGYPPAPEAFANGNVNIDGSTYSTKARLVRPGNVRDGQVMWSLGEYAVIPEGKAYDGWSTDPNSDGGYYIMPTDLSGSITLYAVWVDV